MSLQPCIQKLREARNFISKLLYEKHSTHKWGVVIWITDNTNNESSTLGCTKCIDCGVIASYIYSNNDYFDDEWATFLQYDQVSATCDELKMNLALE